MARRMFYVDEIRGDTAVLEGESAEHLRRVLRAEVGERFEVSDNQALHLAELRALGKNRVEFAVLAPLPVPACLARFHVCVALVKFDRFEWVLEKATELGAATITPVVARRSERGLEEGAVKRTARWRKIVFESGQQARRVVRPEVGDVVALDQVLAIPTGIRFWLDEKPGTPPMLTRLPPTRGPEDQVLLLTGPEGGWEDRERQAAEQAGWLSVSLGPQILRAETAAIAGLAILSASWQATEA